MTQQFEEILEQALAELKSGATTEQVLERYSDQADELAPLLSLATVAFSIPKNAVPTPMRQRRFAEKANRFAWLHVASVMRWSTLPLSLLLIILGTRGVLQAADSSQPTSRLYSIKRAAEELQVSLTRDSDQQVALQLKLTQRRLDELKQASANQDPAQEAAALTQLQDQSQKTFALVPQVAAAKALGQNDPALLNSLVAISKQQKDVVSAIANKPKSETTALATATLNEVHKNRQSLNSILVAVQEQSLADLKHKISVTGDAIIGADKTKITVDSTVFVITKDTVIKGIDGESVLTADLPLKANITVVGSKENNSITAKVLTINNSDTTTNGKDSSGEVKGASTTKPSTPTTPDITKPVVIKKPVIITPPLIITPPIDNTPTPEQTNKDANQVTSGFITEPPAGQYIP